MSHPKSTLAGSVKKAYTVAKSTISVQGARVHNLKNISVDIPKKKLVVVTGVSGSGKSSLVIDTIYAEGQRRYTESLSVYARQFLSRMNKPDVDRIEGLCPAIALGQRVSTQAPRSTVGSITEIHDFLKLLFARIGKIISPISGMEIKCEGVEEALKVICSQKKGTILLILFELKKGKNRKLKEELSIVLQKGFSRIFENNHRQIFKIDDLLLLTEEELNAKLNSIDSQGTLFVLVERIVAKTLNEEEQHSIRDSLATAFFEGEEMVSLAILQEENTTNNLLHFNNKLEADGMKFEIPSTNLFSFNNSYGACPTCEGFSQVLGIDSDLVIPDKKLSVYEGAVAPWKGEKLDWWRQQFITASAKNHFPIHKPVSELTEEQYALLWDGGESVLGIHNFFQEVEQQLYKIQYRVLLSRYRGKTFCPTCKGYRLRKEALYVKINELHIGEICAMSVKEARSWFLTLKTKLTAHELTIAQRMLMEIEFRLTTVEKVGLGYLTLDRIANTLSGGESQRIQLTRILGSNLTDSLYILDEPSIGLHSRDTENLIQVLKNLRDLGNTVVVVEHDEQMMREADYIIDMGPMASHLGGEIVAVGDYEKITHNAQSLTGKYLNGKLQIGTIQKIRKWNRSITIEGATQNNLQNISVTFPLNLFCVVTGVSGSGKTSLVKQILFYALKKIKETCTEKIGMHKKIIGDIDSISNIEMISQNPIGKSSRSNPITYIKAYDEIRELFSKQPLSQMRGLQPKHFSFNVDGGRCDTCKGEGEQVVEMQFLADVHLICELCAGKRFKEEILEVTYKQKNIFEVLEMSVDDALEFFHEEKSIVNAIYPLQEVGLGYIKLGQSSDTLSGGEAQRVKLASFLCKSKNAPKQLFIFDEPTTGLHFHDIKKLLTSFNALIERGHSVIVIEHNLDIIRNADWIIELGPGAGKEGGKLIFSGIPGDLKAFKKSITAQYL